MRGASGQSFFILKLLHDWPAMVQQLPASHSPEVIYPDSDSQPMADNTEQFQWIVTIKENLEILFANDPDIFVAGDLLWYPVQGNNKIRQAPDIMVVFGRPKGKRGSYRQWEEDNIAPQVVFEIISPGNRAGEMSRKLLFYQQYGVEEYYIYDPEDREFMGSVRQGDRLQEIEPINNWISPRLQIRFTVTEETLEIYRPDGQRFLTSVELDRIRQQERQEKEQALAELEAERQRYQNLVERLRERGIDPETL